MKPILYVFFIFLLILQSGCQALKYKKVDAREFPPDPKERVKKNLEEGRGFRLMGSTTKGGTFDFASSNPLWRASLDIASILPIDDIDVFSGTILTDWYSLPSNQNEQIKLAIFVLDKELRSDAIRVIVYVETRNDGIWEDSGIDNLLARNMEDLILTRARELRASSINQ